jgi:hypothetical protein
MVFVHSPSFFSSLIIENIWATLEVWLLCLASRTLVHVMNVKILR